MEKHGYTCPTPIQMQSIPCILEGRDVLGSAPTGSGKTGAYLIPTIAHTYALSKHYQGGSGPYAMILNPTRELCIQIEGQAKQLSEGLENMKTALVVGGMPMPSQIHRLKQGVQLVVGTPGRLLEIITQHEEMFSNIRILVMDEVDAMFKMGFEYQVQRILEMVARQPMQTLMFSATIPSNIERITKVALGPHSVQINVGKPRMPNESVKQTFMWVENPSKKKQLFSILNDPKYFRPPVIIFVESKIGADMLAQAIFKKCHLNAAAIHSNKTQEERTANLQGFIRGEYPVLVSTGVLGRGVDLVDVTQVINFDMATTVDEYIHQVGRAGRLGVPGWSITFINEDHKHLFRELLDILKPLSSKQLTPLPPQLVNSRYAQGGEPSARKKRRFQ
ncbi:DEAD-domain-containing protein [Basidiobolus meristosporus CBS 931.73]|uniref:RNA helicase n=1 Tax=Basidiobolus meristosporus CBS 931.73 TaxID=1314790 RepID=A0A1Y1Z496_9FUNG|nr:DEAD-domain-containing protein [Basidiobolus meristosporus CBS 931.73]|eukprot:ORY05091.1 DEAD-domain-containing protein [Basidiobolus meristosporus CBS 931.73]